MGSKGYKALAGCSLDGTKAWIFLAAWVTWWWYVIAGVCLFGVLAANAGFSRVAEAAPCPGGWAQVFAVVAVEDQTGDSNWQDQLIALGLRNLVNEELFATGCYIPLETDAEVQSVIDDLVRKSWHGQVSNRGESSAGLRAPDCDTEVRICVKSFKQRRSRASLGPFSSGKVTVKVVVELDLRGSDGVVRVVEGVGKGVTRAKGALFQIREDRIYFDESTVGIAAHEAIRSAVQHLIQ